VTDALADKTRQVVLPHEAMKWIAHQSLAGSAIGPLLLNQRFDAEDSIEEADVQFELAEKILLDFAARGKIRIYGTNQDEEDVQIDPAVFAKSQLQSEGIIFWLGSAGDEEHEREYNELAVDYADLTSHFWGGAEEERPSLTRDAQAAPAATIRPLRPMSRAGRRPKHKWAEFTAEVVEYCLSNGAIRQQVRLVEHMKDWCAERWGEEVGDSDARAWVAPIFRKFEKHWRTRGPSGAAENSEPAAENSEPDPAA
jgi:hypothetical protein